MRVLLLNPPPFRGIRYVREGRCEQRLSSFQYNMLPISLLTTAALLRREGHEVRVCDAIARDLTEEALIEEVRAFDPGLTVLSVSTATFRGDAACAAALRAARPGSPLAAFGVHVTALPEDSLRESVLDAVVRGEPELTVAALARALEERTPLDAVAGISWRSPAGGGEGATAIRRNPDRPFLEDLDALPFPARDLVDHRLYPAPVDGRPHTLVVTSRGCPYGCTYCTAHLYYGHRLRRRAPAKVGEEIEEAVHTHGLRLFTFWSDTFTLDREHVRGICREIRGRGLDIEWMANSRVDRVDPELLREMAAAGCRVISFGVESGCQEILDRARKGIRVEQVAPALAACRAAGIRSAAHIILGLPGETPQTLRRTIRFVRRVRPDYVQFYGAIPFPGTPFYEEARTQGWIRAADWPDYEINRCVIATPGLPAAALARWRRRAYLSFYLRPGYLAARLAEVRSPRELARLVAAGAGFLRGWVLPRR